MFTVSTTLPPQRCTLQPPGRGARAAGSFLTLLSAFHSWLGVRAKGTARRPGDPAAAPLKRWSAEPAGATWAQLKIAASGGGSRRGPQGHSDAAQYILYGETL